MRNMKKYLSIMSVSLILTACTSFNDLSGAKEITPIMVNIELDFNIDNLAGMKEMKLILDNYEENLHYEKPLNSNPTQIEGIVPGIYTINATGVALDENGNEYYANGNIVNKGIFDHGTSLEVVVKSMKFSPLIFKEIYYSCSKTPLNKQYIFDQFYEVYNNSPYTIYLDGLYFANLHPNRASTDLPLWPEEDGDDYVYAIRVWKVPGNGQDYPLQPGESCVMAEFAVNHQLDIYNTASPVNLSQADFEFYMDNPSYPNGPVTDMEHVFYEGKAEKGTLKQYLSSVFGGAYVIFQVPEGETWDPVNDPNMSTRDLSTNKAALYAKIPIRYVLDAVEGVDNESKINSKRLPGVLDAGITWVGASNNGLSVSRKLSLDENGDTIKYENGAYVYQDTNNSTDDFERGLKPIIRRHNAGIPAWNYSVNN